MTNHMSKVAEMLGLKMGETFRITKDNDERIQYFRLTEEGIIVSQDSVHWSDTTTTIVLEDILAGRAKVTPLSWKPEKDEVYYIPSISNAVGYNNFYWFGDDTDINHYNLGLVCKTKERAIELSQKMLVAVAKEGKEK